MSLPRDGGGSSRRRQKPSRPFTLPQEFQPEVTRPVTPKQRRAIDRGARLEKVSYDASHLPFRMRHQDYVAGLRQQIERENARDKAEASRGSASLFGVATVRPPSLHDIGRELSGKGDYARLLHTAGTFVAKPLPGIAKNAVQDAFDLPAQAVPSLYVPLASVYEAAKGRPQRGQEFLHNLKEHDPIVLALQGRFGEAVSAAKEHPLATGLEATGVGATISRGAGTLMRSRLATPGMRLAASIERRPKVAPGTSLREVQTYPRGIVGKKRQQASERRREAQAESLRAQARKADELGQEAKARDLRVKADRRDPFRMSEKEIRKRVDQFEGMAYSRQRGRRDERLSEIDHAMKGRAAELVGVVTQAIARATPDDLRAYADHIEAGAKVLEKPKTDSALRTARRIRKAVDSGKVDPQDLKALARTYGEMSVRLEGEAAKRGIIDPIEAERARLMPYAVQHMDTRYREPETVYRQKGDQAPEGEGWVKANGPGDMVIYSRHGRLERANGQTLTNKDIREHMLDPNTGPGRIDPNEVGFLSHAPVDRGGAAFYRHWFQRTGGLPKGRTGAAVREGTFDLHPESLRENIARLGTLIDVHDNFGSFWREFGAKVNGEVVKPMSRRDAEAMKRHLNSVEGGMRWRAIPANPLHGRQAEMQALRDAANVDPFEGAAGVKSPVMDAVEDALQGKGKGGRWVLVPETAAEQELAHIRTLGPGAGPRAWRSLTSAFRRTVLSTSVPWLTGNVTEGGFRSALVGAGPRSHRLMKAVESRLREIDPEAAEQLSHRAFGGGEAGLTKRASLHTEAEQFRGTGLEGIARTLGALRRAKGPKQVVDGWQHYTDFVFNSVNRSVETKFQRAMAGRYVKRNLLDPKGLKISQEAIDQAARGLRDTNEQAALARYLERAYGKYANFSPQARQWIALYTPFAAWTLNAVRFLASVLPKDHPALTAAIAASYQATQEWRAKHGLAKYLEGAAPGFLQGSIPVGEGKLRVSRYLPFGVATDPGASVAGLFLPQARSALAALDGRDWKGDQLKGKDGKELTDDQKVAHAFLEFAKSTIPALNQGIRLAHGEGRKVINPFEPTRSPKGGKIVDTGPGRPKTGIDWSQLKVGGSAGGKIDWSQVKIGG